MKLSQIKSTIILGLKTLLFYFYCQGYRMQEEGQSEWTCHHGRWTGPPVPHCSGETFGSLGIKGMANALSRTFCTAIVATLI